MEMGFSQILLLSFKICLVLDSSLFNIFTLCFQCVLLFLVALFTAFDSPGVIIFLTKSLRWLLFNFCSIFSTLLSLLQRHRMYICAWKHECTHYKGNKIVLPSCSVK